jgi:hypothetical protein
VATTTDAAAKPVASAVLEDLFRPSGRTFALRFWDGRVEGPNASFEPGFTLRRPGRSGGCSCRPRILPWAKPTLTAISISRGRIRALR